MTTFARKIVKAVLSGILTFVVLSIAIVFYE